LSPAERLHQENRRLRRQAEDLRAELDRLRARADEHAQRTEPEPAGHAPLRMLPFWDVPVIINSFNRLGSLRRLVGWLLHAEHARVVVVDNASSYPPLLRYLAELEERGHATVVRLDSNLGHLAIWRCGLLERLGIDSEYVYTDPDVVPAEFCPPDLVGHLQAVLADNPNLAVAGVGLRLDDLPDAYGHKDLVLGWERQFWCAPAAPNLFHASIDTTFALYRPGSGHALGSPAVRTGWPYLAAHEGWYLDHAAPSEEDLFYRAAAAPGAPTGLPSRCPTTSAPPRRNSGPGTPACCTSHRAAAPISPATCRCRPGTAIPWPAWVRTASTSSAIPVGSSRCRPASRSCAGLPRTAA
ncbi:MAG TPA: hypothetical protein VFY87_13915, partial [Geminicoccaceae bacterium]|nr:hypothetical protein [Geminicoccaceae bacterium]